MTKISESKILFWLSLTGLTVKKQADLINALGSARNLWDDFDKKSSVVREIAGQEHLGELRRYRSEEFIDACLDKLK